MICKFEKLYNEKSNKPYNIFVASLFFYDNYVRLGKKGVYSDKTVEKQLIFLKNLMANIENLYKCKYIPDDWKLRIYFDESLFNFKYKGLLPWKLFLDIVIKLDRVQLVKFECPDYFDVTKREHIKVFGMLVRFHPFFHKEPNVKMMSIVDADNMLSGEWVSELLKFAKSDYQFNVFCSKYEFPRYKDIELEDSYDCYFRGGIFSSKVFFQPSDWENIFRDINNPNSEFSKSFKRILKRLDAFYPNEIQNRNDPRFEFGFDEMILNFFIKKLLKKYNYSVRYVHYRPSLNIFCDYLYAMLKNPINKQYTDELLKKTNYKSLDDLYKYLKKGVWRNDFFKRMQILKDNLGILKKMYIDPVLLSFIENETWKTFTKYRRFEDYLKMVC